MPVPVESKEAALLELVFPFISFACFDIAQVSMGSYFLPSVPGFIVNDSSSPFGWIQCLPAIIRDLGFTVEDDPSDFSPFVLFLSYSSVVVAKLLFFFFFIAGMDHSFSGLLLVDLNSYILVNFPCSTGGPNHFFFFFCKK